MAMARLNYLTEDQVKAIADPLLHKKLDQFGFIRSSIEEVEDFDGIYIFRLVATVEETVPAGTIVETTEEIHSALRQQGDDRFVILSTERAGAEADLPDEDVN